MSDSAAEKQRDKYDIIADQISPYKAEGERQLQEKIDKTAGLSAELYKRIGAVRGEEFTRIDREWAPPPLFFGPEQNHIDVKKEVGFKTTIGEYTVVTDTEYEFSRVVLFSKDMNAEYAKSHNIPDGDRRYFVGELRLDVGLRGSLEAFFRWGLKKDAPDDVKNEYRDFASFDEVGCNRVHKYRTPAIKKPSDNDVQGLLDIVPKFIALLPADTSPAQSKSASKLTHDAQSF